MNTVHLDGGGVVAARERIGGASPVARSKAEKDARKAAGQLVGQAFFAPMLAQMRNSPFKSEMFSGGKAGETFGSLMDQQLVEHMADGSDRLSSSIVKRILTRAEAVEAGREVKRIVAENAALMGKFKGQEVTSHVDITG